MRDSTTASVAGIREVRQAAHQADTSTTTTSSSAAATAGSGLTLRGRDGGSIPLDTSSRRNRSAST
jgi:hypothetical protein